MRRRVMARRRKKVTKKGFLVVGMASDVKAQVNSAVYTDELMAQRAMSKIQQKMPHLDWRIKPIDVIGRE